MPVLPDENPPDPTPWRPGDPIVVPDPEPIRPTPDPLEPMLPQEPELP